MRTSRHGEILELFVWRIVTRLCHYLSLLCRLWFVSCSCTYVVSMRWLKCLPSYGVIVITLLISRYHIGITVADWMNIFRHIYIFDMWVMESHYYFISRIFPGSDLLFKSDLIEKMRDDWKMHIKIVPNI